MGGPRNPYYKTPTYTAWDSMLQRCTNENQKHYNNYGGRGIGVCDRWLLFKNFIEDMGLRPFGLSLDRIDNSKGYYKENCRWADKKTQQRNMRTNHLITFQGQTKTLAEWAEIKKMGYSTLQTRLWRGWTIERAMQ